MGPQLADQLSVGSSATNRQDVGDRPGSTTWRTENSRRTRSALRRRSR
ncbi:hypothetical protein ABZ754_00555 [Micromonospora purpureochromogenes]